MIPNHTALHAALMVTSTQSYYVFVLEGACCQLILMQNGGVSSKDTHNTNQV